MYKFEVKTTEKVFLITASGFFKEDEANQYIQDLKQQLARIPNPKDYHLIINAKEQKTVTQNVQKMLEETISLYFKTSFKSYHTVMFDSVTSKAQILRAGNKEVATRFEFHETLEAALQSCKGLAGSLR